LSDIGWRAHAYSALLAFHGGFSLSYTQRRGVFVMLLCGGDIKQALALAGELEL
jgi:hypothetical protein